MNKIALRSAARATFMCASFVAAILLPSMLCAQWVTSDVRGPTRGPWTQALPRELPQLYREFNGIDFGHAHLAEALLLRADRQDIERARLEVLDFIFSSPAVPPDEEQIAPKFSRLVWEVQKSFSWAHSLHRSLYDLFADDRVIDKRSAYRKLIDSYLSKPEAIASFPLDHHGKLWSWPESKSFRDRHPAFNAQIWAYHWLQAAVYDVQLMGGTAVQKKLMPEVISHYHRYLTNPPLTWQNMPMMAEAAPVFSLHYPEAAAIFDNLHMLHDNVDDVLSSPELYPTNQSKREQILRILAVYLHRNQMAEDRFRVFRAKEGADHGHMAGERPPSVQSVLGMEKQDAKETGQGHRNETDAHIGHH